MLSLLSERQIIWQSLQLNQRAIWVAKLAEPYPGISGNKIAKLHYPLLQVQQQNLKGVVTFGGAFSNHLLATAVACQLIHAQSIGLVRGDSIDPNNPTLIACQDHGMTLLAIKRNEYRLRHQASYLSELKQAYRDYLLVPEGGTSAQGVAGVSMLNLADTPAGKAAHIFCPVGSGGTLAGLANGHPDQQVHGIAVVKDKRLPEQLQQYSLHQNWQLYFDFVGKGYGRFDQTHWHLCQVASEQNVDIEPIYTAKALMGLLALAPQLADPIVFFHTGGLQGLAGIRYRQLADTLMPNTKLT